MRLRRWGLTPRSAASFSASKSSSLLAPRQSRGDRDRLSPAVSQQAQQAQNRLHGIAGSPSYCPFHAGSLPPSPLGPSPRRPPRHPQPHLSLKTGSADAELVRTCAAVCHKEGGTRRRFVDSNGRGDVINTEAVMCWRRLAASREHGAAGARTRAPPPMAMLMLMAAGQTPLWGEARHCQTTDERCGGERRGSGDARRCRRQL